MRLVRCDQCERTEPEDEASGWFEVTQDGDSTVWLFCSLTCVAAWSADAL